VTATISPDLPLDLKPTHSVPTLLPSGLTLALLHCRPSFPKWKGPEPEFDFGGKTFLDFEGQPVFAEIYILRLLERAGWEGVWVSSFGGKLLRDTPTSWKLENAINLPQSEFTSLITTKAGKPGGCFDIFAWRGENVMFCELKRHSRDKLRESQRHWMDAALASGVPEASLLVVEWSLTG
jgi:hypothetical protein